MKNEAIVERRAKVDKNYSDFPTWDDVDTLLEALRESNERDRISADMFTRELETNESLRAQLSAAQLEVERLTEDRTAAFHRGVDAAKDAIRAEFDASDKLFAAWDKSDAEFDTAVAESRNEDKHFYAAAFINAIARKCGRDGEK